MKSIAAICFGMVLLANTAFGGHDGTLPTWVRGEHLSDKAKIKQLNRKAEYEQAREASFDRRGIDYKPTKDSLQVALPQTVDDGIERLGQLNRIHSELSKAARPWNSYEFGLVKKYTKRLIER